METETRGEQPSTRAARAQDVRGSVEEGQGNILLVEDDAGVAMTLTDVLESEGYTVTHVGDGASAKSQLDEANPDLIILDLMLPDSDGLVLCSDLKARADVPIIICSATSRKRDAVLGFKLGADDFVAKPFHVDELLTRVQAAMRRSAARQRDAAAAERAPAEPSPGFGLASGMAANGLGTPGQAGQPAQRRYEVG